MSGIDARFSGRIGTFSLDVALKAPSQGVTGIFGPSGCGKTTLLRCIAGLNRLTDGYLSVDGAIWQDSQRFLAPHRRSVGYVFQEPRLFAHLSVLGNLRYGLARVPPASRTIGLEPIIELMGIGGLLQRSPAGLSGGERQRIAIGRALLAQPRLLLMDEPLSALDHDSKAEILPYLETLPAALAVPILYVSHDRAEIERLADRLVLMSRDGRVQAAGAVAALLTDLSLPLARMPEAASVLSVEVESYDEAYDLTSCVFDSLRFLVPGALGLKGVRRRIRVAASDVSLIRGEPHSTSVLNILPAHVLSAEPASANQMLVVLRLGAGEHRLLSSITRKSWDGLGLRVGDPVFAQVKGMAVVDRR